MGSMVAGSLLTATANEELWHTYLESNGQTMQGPDCFAFLGEVFIKPSRTFDRLIKEDLCEGVRLVDNRTEC
jgi:hypothetical protein